ncbi:predicted protein [Pyrenophora tritici-repentis Pt-1C-BFP]|uniref:Uncharacterized protein n=1 Tax=Pyrenophora tritici-repentis (strain Pt-1C-BFP) TaxID=426418 RepID=B2VW83_PYRTR|nr:uncharacterized protein PTRG_01445 [Pyrenophora tritici-repentis Pt-1C-BFP]EDU40883.1 predicted protein [Pyrenophora tritici-repentis Pt-1C-BFP]
MTYNCKQGERKLLCQERQNDLCRFWRRRRPRPSRPQSERRWEILWPKFCKEKKYRTLKSDTEEQERLNAIAAGRANNKPKS